MAATPQNAARVGNLGFGAIGPVLPQQFASCPLGLLTIFANTNPDTRRASDPSNVERNPCQTS
jgi:hypothetical protein